jgi:hypothetical protein
MREKIIVILIFSVIILSGCTGNNDNYDDKIKIKDTEISIACWNLQVLGPTKLGDEELMDYYIEKLNNYDIFIVQEIRDKGGGVIKKLTDETPEYGHVFSERAGTSISKEQYGVFFLKEKVVLLGVYDYTMEQQGNISRPPLQVSFKSRDWYFDIFTLHADPDEVPSDLYYTEKIIGKPEIDTILIGDLNADGVYYDEDDIQHFVDWYWVLPNSVDTTVASSNNTYDRIIVNRPCKNNFVSYGVMSDVTSGQSDHYLIYGIFDVTADE